MPPVVLYIDRVVIETRRLYYRYTRNNILVINTRDHRSSRKTVHHQKEPVTIPTVSDRCRWTENVRTPRSEEINIKINKLHYLSFTQTTDFD